MIFNSYQTLTVIRAQDGILVHHMEAVLSFEV